MVLLYILKNGMNNFLIIVQKVAKYGIVIAFVVFVLYAAEGLYGFLNIA